MRRTMLGLSAILCAAGCGAPTEQPPANNASTTAAEPKKHPTYCFFKNADTKGWGASRAAGGAVAVAGQAHIADRRYRAVLGDPEIAGDQARLWLTMAPNTSGVGAPEDWWEVSASVPDSAAVAKVTVLCGKKVVAELPLKKR